MSSQKKTKRIQKNSQRDGKKGQKNSNGGKQLGNPSGQPEIKGLNDFVTALTPSYTSSPIYTGGRILALDNRLYCSCNSGVVIFDLNTKQKIGKIQHSQEDIANFGVGGDGERVATFTDNGTLRILDKQLRTLHLIKLGKLFAQNISFSPDNRHLAIGFSNGLIRIYTVETMKETHSYSIHRFPLRLLEWHPSPQLLQLISADQSKHLVVFDYVLNKTLGQVQAGRIFCLVGNYLVTAYDQELRVYQYKSLRLLRKVEVGFYVEALHLASKDVLLFGGQQTELYKTNIGELGDWKQVKGATERGVAKILGADGGKKTIIVSVQQNLTILSTHNLQVQEVIVGFNDQIIDIKFSRNNPSDYYLLLTNSSMPKLFRTQNHQLASLITGHDEIVLCADYSHPWLLTAGKDKTIRLWTIDSHAHAQPVAIYRGHSDDVCGLTLLLQNQLIVSVGEDKTLKLWPLLSPTGAPPVSIKSALATVMGHDKTINAVRASPREDMVATCSHDRTVKVWDRNLRLLFTLKGHRRGVWDAAFHEAELLLVTAGGDGMLKGWSLVDGDCLWSMGEGLGLVRCQWLYHHQVVTGSIDGILKIWDIRKKTSLSYDKHEGKVWALQVQKDQNGKCVVASGANDSVYYFWRDSTEETRGRIMRQNQAEQRDRIGYEQMASEGNFLGAAKLAFDSGYRQLFFTAIEELLGGYDPNSLVEVGEEGLVGSVSRSPGDLRQLVQHACQKDIGKLLELILTMNSTVRHFKGANKILLEVLRLRGIKGVAEGARGLEFGDNQEQTIESGVERFVRLMRGYTERHYQRTQKYIRASYWVDHLEETY